MRHEAIYINLKSITKNEKFSQKRVHTVYLHLYRILDNTKYSIVTESRSVLFFFFLGKGGEGERERERQDTKISRKHLRMMEVFIVLIVVIT